MAITVATWNINSVRLRLDLVLRFLEEHRPDVLCLQETKAIVDAFPAKAFAEKGWRHQAIRGMKSYNGVAILSSQPLTDVGSEMWCAKDDCRHVFATLPGGVELHNFYIPSGGDIPDPAVNAKFAHKLAFLDETTAWLEKARQSDRPMVLVGDLNIAPLEHDVWSHKQLLDVVSHTPIEVEKLTAMQEAGGWVDAVRHFTPADQKLYSWWSYRAQDWNAADRGRRLDHVWVTQPLVAGLRQARILREARGWTQPSDHVPVLVTLDAGAP